MKTSSNGINLIKSFEGCHLKSYKCPSGVWTIGYGHTYGVKEGQTISQNQAEEFLKADLEKYEKYVTNTGLLLNQNQFDALVSFTYNCGSGNLNKLINNRSLTQIADAMLLYNKSKGTVLKGLERRRQAERELFLKEVNVDMGKTGQGLAEYAIGKVGTPYFYGSKIQYGKLTENYMKKMHNAYPKTVTTAYMKKARNRGQVGVINTDCSGLVSGYTGKIIGSYQMYQQAYTRLPISKYKDFANGTTVWRSGHVGVFFELDGKYYVSEAKGIDYGTVISEFVQSKWSCGLTFKELTYSYEKNLSGEASWKGTNPYTEPTRIIKRYCKGEDVKWVQWELREAGFDRPFAYNGKTYDEVKIDGDAGEITDAAIGAFQASCKIKVDKKCGAITREYLKAN